jgi:hypothetical protein
MGSTGDGGDEERLAAFFEDVLSVKGTQDAGSEGVQPGSSPPNTWESLIQGVPPDIMLVSNPPKQQ